MSNENETTEVEEQASEEPSTPEQPALEEKAPFFRAMDKIGQGISTIREELNGALRYDPEPPEPVSLIETPIYVAGHEMDGFVLNGIRETGNILGRIKDSIRASISTVGGAILLQPLWKAEWYKRPFHAVSGLVTTGTNAIKAPINYINGITDRSIKNATEQTNFQIERIPLVGPIVAGTTNFIARSINTIAKTVKRAADLITAPLDGFHAATGPSK